MRASRGVGPRARAALTAAAAGGAALGAGGLVGALTDTTRAGIPGALGLGALIALPAAAIAAGVVYVWAKARARRAGDAPTWVAPGHFYSPIPDPAQVRADAPRLFAPGARALAGIDLRLDAQRALVRELAACYRDDVFAAQPRADRRYCLANDFFPFGDAFAWHALLRRLRPARVIEIGSGWSSAVLLDTIDEHLPGGVACTFVEPFPERLRALLRPDDHARVRLLEQRVQDVPLAEFDALQANDVLFVDSSHVCKTGSDVHHILFEILPRLRSGVWVHVHDVFANFEYPPAWLEQNRAWNESYFVRAFLTGNADWSIELHAATLAAAGAPELRELAPKWAADLGGSLWLRRR